MANRIILRNLTFSRWTASLFVRKTLTVMVKKRRQMRDFYFSYNTRLACLKRTRDIPSRFPPRRGAINAIVYYFLASSRR